MSVSIERRSFGHGGYTSYDAMLFNAHLLATHFYPGFGRGGR